MNTVCLLFGCLLGGISIGLFTGVMLRTIALCRIDARKEVIELLNEVHKNNV